MSIFGEIDKNRKTAIYIRISTSMQQTDRQREELLDYAMRNDIVISEEDIYVDIISGFKEGETRPNYGILKRKVEDGVYQQILFSEFSRLDRKPSNLLKSIEYYQSKDVHLFFKKQNLWVRDKSDLSTSIMISVLAVMSQYEIELFVARGVDGKVSAIKNRGISQGGFTAYGYTTTDIEKKLVINEEEAEVVRRIFQYYKNGVSSLEIADILNAEGIPAPYKKRFEVSDKKRIAKGLAIKEKRINLEELRWRPSTLNRLIKNELYIGKREFKFYEPDPSNPLPTHLRKDRKVLHEFKIYEPELCIVDEETFYEVQRLVDEKRFNKNLGIRHDNLLKHLLRCGDCGSRYSVGGGMQDRKYKCYGTVNRTDKPKTCTTGTETQMKRLDGLVLQLCIAKFADYNIEQEVSGKIEQIDKEISEKTELISNHEAKLKTETDTMNAFIGKVIRIVEDEEQAKIQIDAERARFKKIADELQKSITRIKGELTNLKMRKASLTKMKSNSNLMARQNEIRTDRTLVKEYVNEFISEITIHRMSKLWSLVIVHFIDGGEMWGTVKNFRYKKTEMFYDPALCSCPEYPSWFLNNQDLSLTYDKEAKTITYNGKSELYNTDFGQGVIEAGTYTPEEFNEILTNVGWIGSYPPYQFEI